MKWLLPAIWFLAEAPAWAAEGAAAHGDPVAKVVLSLAIILVAAKLGGDLATRLGQPPVRERGKGDLGNATLAGFSGFDYLRSDASVDMLSRIGVIILLFEVGLESTVAQMLQVGLSSFLVATFGVIGPFLLGWGVGAWLLPEHSLYVHIFLGATLTATSVGITARVLKDLGQAQSKEARIVIGAAVIDDVLGLLILAVVGGIIAAANTGGSLSYGSIGLILVKAALFLIGSLAVGLFLSPRLFRLASKLRTHGVLLAVGLGFCFLLSWLADAIGLAPIVGAFAAGLILENVHYRNFTDRGEHELEELVHPISSFLAPVFFVVMGTRIDLRVFADPSILWLAAALTVAAIAGKQIAGFGVIGKGIDRLSVGIGMIPRGEVGLIFANIGLTLLVAGERIVDQSVFSAVVVMIIVTTMITPPALKWSLERRSRHK